MLGALIEKQYTTPDVYPLTMNSLVAACNQASNRSPVVSYDADTVQRALDGLREEGLTRVVHSPSNRATKYRQVLDELHAFERDRMALLCVLLLRGPQTVGELRGRTERMHQFDSLGAVEEALDHPLVERMERRPGQKDVRYRHTMGEAPEVDETAVVATSMSSGLGAEVARLRADLDQLRQEFDALRAELGGEPRGAAGA